MTIDTVCNVMNASKLITCVAVMQSVERGLLELDKDVREVLSQDFADLEIIESIRSDVKPVVVPLECKLTLRYE